MAADEPFRRYEQAGAAFVDAAVNRLNGLFRGASDRGHHATDRGDEAADQGDEATDRAEERRGSRGERTEHLLELVRSEIRSQLLQLGLATREDIADVRSRLEALEARLGDLESRVAEREDSGPGGADAGGTPS